MGFIQKVMGVSARLRKECFRKHRVFTLPGIHVLTTGNLHTEGLGFVAVYQGAQPLWGGSVVL